MDMRKRILRKCGLVVVAVGAVLLWSAGDRGFTARAGAPSRSWLKLGAAKDFVAEYRGDASVAGLMRSGQAQPLSMIAADLDRDGAQDAVAGYAAAGGGLLAIYPGNLDAYAPRDPSLYQEAAAGRVADSLRGAATVIAVPVRADFLAAGDFNNDGNPDLLVAAQRGGLYFLAGDGSGNFADAVRVEGVDGVTALTAGPFGSAGDRTIVAVSDRTGPAVLVFQHDLNRQPVRYPLPAEASSLATGLLDGDWLGDVAVAAGYEVVVLHGNDGSGDPAAQLEHIALPFRAVSLELGDFVADRGKVLEIAVLSDSGTLQIIERGDLDTRPFTAAEIAERQRTRLARAEIAPPAWQFGGADSWKLGPVMESVAAAGARLSSGRFSRTSLTILDSGRRRMQFVSMAAGNSSAAADAPVAVDIADAAVAAVAMPAKLDGSRELLVLGARGSLRTVHSQAAGSITVDRTDDAASASACTAAPNDCSLRWAVIYANSNPGTTIDVPAGTYQLTIDGSSEAGSCTDATKGDLDIAGNNTTITGAGAAITIIQQTMPHDRVMCVDQFLVGNFIFTMSGVTIAGGRETFGVGGGGVISGDPGDVTNITNVTMANNQASGGGSPVGGGLANGAGSLNVTGSTFGGANPPGASQTDVTKANQSAGSGGGVYYSANNHGGGVVITTSTFLNNVTSGNGGGLITTQAVAHSVSHSTFSGNLAQLTVGRGGGLFNESGTLTLTTSTFLNNRTGGADASAGGGAVGSADGGGQNVSIQYCRFVGNTTAVATGGNTIRGGAGSTMTANDNWWGDNTGPATNDAVNATVANYLKLSNTPSPATINGPGGVAPNSTTLTASFLQDSAGNSVATANLAAMIGLPLTWGNATLGNLSSQQTSVQLSGTATATFTAGATGGTGHADATVDNGTATANITVNEPPVVGTDPTDQSACAGSNVTFTAAASGTPAPGEQWQVSTDGGTTFSDIGGATSASYTHAALTSENNYRYRAFFTNSAGTAISSSARLTVNTAPVVTTNPTSQSVTAGQSVSFTAAATGSPTVQWQVSTNGGATFSDISGATLTTYTHTAALSENNYQYRAVFTNACVSVNSTAATLTVAPAASVTSVSSTTANGTYGVGASIAVTVTFSRAVTVTGTPLLALNSGGTASYVSGSGTGTLTFGYTVAAGQSSAHLDYSSTGALTLNGGSIVDSNSAAANLTLPAPGAAGSLSANTNLAIDGVAPTVTSFSVLFGSQSYNLVGSGRNRLPWQITGIRAVFSKPIAAGDVSSLSGVTASGFSGLGTNTLTWAISPLTLGNFSAVLAGSGAHALKDAAGNSLSGGTGFTQNFRVLYGDFTDDGYVSTADLAQVNAARTAPYNIFADINGNGVVDISDVQLVRTLIGASLP